MMMNKMHMCRHVVDGFRHGEEYDCLIANSIYAAQKLGYDKHQTIEFILYPAMKQSKNPSIGVALLEKYDMIPSLCDACIYGDRHTPTKSQKRWLEVLPDMIKVLKTQNEDNTITTRIVF